MRNLPVILLRELILLPYNDIRLEFDNDISKTIIDVAEIFHDGYIFVVTQDNPLEENPDISDLPRIGVIGKISHKLELPNGKTRVVITGLRRAYVNEYIHPDSEIMEVIVSELRHEEIPDDVVRGTIRKLYNELDNYVKSVPYVSNGLLSLISNAKDISKMTDIVVMNIPIDSERLIDYVNETSTLKRVEMILEDIYKEEQLFEIEKKLDSKVKKEIDNNQKEFLLREKVKIIREELGEESFKESDVEELENKVKQLKCPDKVKKHLLREIKKYENIPSTSPEISMVRNYIDWLIELPWGVYTDDYNDIDIVRKNLDATHFGLNSVKERIIEYLAVKKYTKLFKGPIICLVGPPGVGKTTLAYSISKSINRRFVKISLGGISDEAEIVGHKRTYLGSSPGRIIEGIRKCGSSNPVILIDEIDKMMKSYRGDPANSLLEVLDPIQNKYFRDNYIEEEFDLSDVLFILTANSTYNIPTPLLDRLEIINVCGYTEYEKLDIAKNYLLPKICKNHKINDLNISDNGLLDIIHYYTKEAGVRELERKLSTIVRKIVTNLVSNENEVSEIDCNLIQKYLGKKKYRDDLVKQKEQIGVVNGLSYTQYGGDIIPIEVNYYKGRGNLILTGSLGSVARESAKIALSYIKANYKLFNINYNDLINNDIHIHIPSGSVSKDGPSAGVSLTTALISAFTNLKIDSNVAMTGEITLRGNILAIGGLKEKSIGARRNNIKKIFIPYDNIVDLDDIPDEIKSGIEYIPVKNYMEIFKNIVR